MTIGSVCVTESSPPTDCPVKGGFSVPEHQPQRVKDCSSMGHILMDQINRWFVIHCFFLPEAPLQQPGESLAVPGMLKDSIPVDQWDCSGRDGLLRFFGNPFPHRHPTYGCYAVNQGQTGSPDPLPQHRCPGDSVLFRRSYCRGTSYPGNEPQNTPRKALLSHQRIPDAPLSDDGKGSRAAVYMASGNRVLHGTAPEKNGCHCFRDGSVLRWSCRGNGRYPQLGVQQKGKGEKSFFHLLFLS